MNLCCPAVFTSRPPYTYRNPFNETDPERLAQLCAQALEDEIAFQGAGTIAAFIMEPILGAGGVIPPHPSFMPMVREICDRNGILLIADEVNHGLWPHGVVVRLTSLGCAARHDVYRKSHYQWLLSVRRRPDRRKDDRSL